MTCADRAESRQYFVVADVDLRETKVRQRFEYTDGDERRLGEEV